MHDGAYLAVNGDVLTTVYQAVRGAVDVYVANADNYTVVETSDYGCVPKLYVDIHVGQWDRPYRVTAA